MRVAISTDGEMVSAHFGRCPSFTIVDIEGGKVVKRERIDNPGHQTGYIPTFLHEKGAGFIVAGGMGRRATALFQELGIDTIMGITGRVDEVIEDIVSERLQGGESLCSPGAGKGYGLEKEDKDHSHHEEE